MKTQLSKSTKSSNHKFFRFLALSFSVSAFGTIAAIGVDVLQHKDKADLATWAYVGLGAFISLVAPAAISKLVGGDQ